MNILMKKKKKVNLLKERKKRFVKENKLKFNEYVTK